LLKYHLNQLDIFTMRKQLILCVILGIAFCVLQFNLWTGHGGLMQFWQLKNGIAEQEAENAQLAARNSTLHAEVVDLKQGHAAIEERARSELGMVKSGETFYQIMENDVERTR
jgi:cell division protein FtsB